MNNTKPKSKFQQLKSAIVHWIIEVVGSWAQQELRPTRAFLSDFDRLSYEVRLGDVLLVEGDHRISRIIELVTLSPWTHSVLYIGRLHDIEDENLREMVKKILYVSAHTSISD